MLLLTQGLRARLIDNGKSLGDHVPVVKFLNPVWARMWNRAPESEKHSANSGWMSLAK